MGVATSLPADKREYAKGKPSCGNCLLISLVNIQVWGVARKIIFQEEARCNRNVGRIFGPFLLPVPITTPVLTLQTWKKYSIERYGVRLTLPWTGVDMANRRGHFKINLEQEKGISYTFKHAEQP